jgi:hypothetical protein
MPGVTICKECVSAAIRPWHGFAAGCNSCMARAAARSWQYDKAAKGQENTDYKALLTKLGLKHSEVQAARAADAMTTCAHLEKS